MSENGQIKFSYLRDPKRDRFVCIARRVITLDSGAKGVEFAYAISMPGDSFTKKAGRRIAATRLQKGSLNGRAIYYTKIRLNGKQTLQAIYEYLSLPSERDPKTQDKYLGFPPGGAVRDMAISKLREQL